MSQARVATVVFAVVVIAAVPLYLWRGRHQWFYLDEWDYLAARKATSLHDLLRPHNEHWQTLPILAYRALWNIVGLHSYKPYQLVTIGLHLTAACLLRVVMRRAGVGPWIATIAASLFVLFGPGHENVIWAFQVGFVGSLVCGLAHLILADHDGPLDRRDAIGLLFGIAGLMSSGVGVTMAFVVGLAALMRRGWRAAAFHLVPLAVLFLGWWLVVGRDAYSPSPGSVAEVARVRRGRRAQHVLPARPAAGHGNRPERAARRRTRTQVARHATRPLPEAGRGDTCAPRGRRRLPLHLR